MYCANCGQKIDDGSKFCGFCGYKMVEDTATVPIQENYAEPNADKKKKGKKGIIGVFAVIVILLVVGCGGFMVWNLQHSNVSDNQVVYSKNGKLYYMKDASKDKESVEIYDSCEENVSTIVSFSKNRKNLYFQDWDTGELYYVNAEKLTSNDDKNEKYIQQVDSNVQYFKCCGEDKMIYWKDAGDSQTDLYYFDGQEREKIRKNVHWYEDDYQMVWCSDNVVYFYASADRDEDALLGYYDIRNGEQGEIHDVDRVIDYNDQEILYTVCDEGDKVNVCMSKIGGSPKRIISTEHFAGGNLAAKMLYFLESDEDIISNYTTFDGKSGELEDYTFNLYFSEDGKYAIADYDIYKINGKKMKKIDSIESHSGRWIGNNYYYVKDDNSFWCFSDGKNKKIMDKVDGVQVEPDGNYLARVGDSLKFIKEKEQIKIPENYGVYCSKSCILYWKEGKLYAFDGKNSRLIDDEVRQVWSSTDESKAYIDGSTSEDEDY